PFPPTNVGCPIFRLFCERWDSTNLNPLVLDFPHVAAHFCVGVQRKHLHRLWAARGHSLNHRTDDLESHEALGGLPSPCSYAFPTNCLSTNCKIPPLA